MATKKKKLTPYEKRLRKILKQVSGDVSNIEGDLIPPMIIKGKGIIYCYQPSAREFIKVCRGSNVFVVREEDLAGKVLIYTCEGQLVEIEASELSLIGFN
tara:strand:- start:825 stop:1124 length:300 start_codon:yes stop_codon:yes gene_type:complete